MRNISLRFRVPALAVGLFVAVLSSAAFAFDAPGGVSVATTAKGKTLVDAKAMTLYTFAPDPSGISTCVGPCAKNWPPLAAPAGAKAVGDFAAIARPDGGSQWAYKGKPLYRWNQDKKPGDITGDGFLGKWSVVQP